MRRNPVSWHARPGMTVVELLLATVLGSVVMIGVLTMFIAENSRLSVQRELSDTWLTLAFCDGAARLRPAPGQRERR